MKKTVALTVSLFLVLAFFVSCNSALPAETTTKTDTETTAASETTTTAKSTPDVPESKITYVNEPYYFKDPRVSFDVYDVSVGYQYNKGEIWGDNYSYISICYCHYWEDGYFLTSGTGGIMIDSLIRNGKITSIKTVAPNNLITISCNGFKFSPSYTVYRVGETISDIEYIGQISGKNLSTLESGYDYYCYTTVTLTGRLFTDENGKETSESGKYDIYFKISVGT